MYNCLQKGQQSVSKSRLRMADLKALTVGSDLVSSIGVGGTSAVFILDFNTGFFRLDFFALDFSTLTPNYGIKYSNQNIVIKQ